MSDPLAPVDDASTPLSPEEKEDLIPSYITTRGELNEAEQNNILKAEDWAFSRKRNELNTKFLNDLHKRMFGRVWKWAGRHGRLATDLLLISLERKRFSWGSDNLVDAGVTRASYVRALQAADKHDFQPLFEFVRS